LLVDNVSNGIANVLILEEPSSAAMARPALAIGFIASCLIQRSARVRFESVHDSLWPYLGFDDYVHMIRPNVSGE
jgi:hypothetical protein